MEIDKGVGFVSAQFHVQALFDQRLARADEFEAAVDIPEDDIIFFAAAQIQTLAQAALAHLAAGFVHIASRSLDPAAGFGVFVVINNQGAFMPETVGIGENIFVNVAFRGENIVEQEVFNLGEQVTATHERVDNALVVRHQAFVGFFVPVGAAVFHPVFLVIAFNLTVTDHRQAGQGCHQRADAEILIAVAKLFDGGLFIGVVHEVDIALHDLWIELQRVFHHRAILGVIFVTQHVHES